MTGVVAPHVASGDVYTRLAMLACLQITASASERRLHYEAVIEVVSSLLEPEVDWISALATVTCELHQAFDYFDWTGFYRAKAESVLVVGPYQGGHGCLRIEFSRGVCGAAARSRRTQRIADVHDVSDHIACSATTRSEIVVPVLAPDGRVLGVLDVDSDAIDAFTEVDQEKLEELCASLGQRYGQLTAL